MEIIVDNVRYELNKKNKTAAVRGYQGELANIKLPEYIKYKFRKYTVTEEWRLDARWIIVNESF